MKRMAYQNWNRSHRWMKQPGLPLRFLMLALALALSSEKVRADDQTLKAKDCESESLLLLAKWNLKQENFRQDLSGNLVFGLQENKKLAAAANLAKPNEEPTYTFKNANEVTDANLGKGWLAPPNSIAGTLNGMQAVITRTVGPDKVFHTKIIHRGWIRNGKIFTRINDVEINLYPGSDGSCKLADFTFFRPHKITVTGKECLYINSKELTLTMQNQPKSEAEIIEATRKYLIAEKKITDQKSPNDQEQAEFHKIALSCNDRISQSRLKNKSAFFSSFIADPHNSAQPEKQKPIIGLLDLFAR